MANVRLTEDQYKKVKKMLASNMKQSDICEILDLNKSTVSRISTGKYDALFETSDDPLYVTETVPKSNDAKFFEVSSSLNMLQVLSDQMIQQNDEIIYLLTKILDAWG